MFFFGIVLLVVFTLMQVYVFGRAASVPFIARRFSRRSVFVIGLTLWVAFFAGRSVEHSYSGPIVSYLELFGMCWLAALFLIFFCLLVADIVTGFGLLFPKLAPALRGWALIAGCLLSSFALIQGMRPPVVRSYEVELPRLPVQYDGTIAVVISDTHLGSLIGETWLAARVAQIRRLKPDLIFLLGDIFEGHGRPAGAMLADLRQLSAPMGLWAVPGNHEWWGSGAGMDVLQEAGFQVLQNRWSEVRPGLTLIGVQDLTMTHRHGNSGADPLGNALPGLPAASASILLSHSPLQARRAADAGVGLMLCGHTHGGQIWPFSYLVRLSYSMMGGRYGVNGMTVIVCRGTGTWGPRMRLWLPGEILKITLRSPGRHMSGN